MKDTNELVKQLRAKYRPRAIDPDGLFLLEADVAAQMIREGLERGLTFASVDGFVTLPSGSFQPTQDFTNGVVDPPDEGRFLEGTFELLRRGKEAGVHFEVWFFED